jgi:CSLREA domain-containing protein
MSKNIFWRMAIILLISFGLAAGSSLSAATFTVNTTTDTVDSNPGDGTAIDADGHCSLRAAIMEANALYGPDTIEIPAGTYKSTISDIDEDGCTRGDLDILSNLTIQGAGMDQTIIDGNSLDRVLHIIGSIEVTISDLTIQNGHAPDCKYLPEAMAYASGENGGGIYIRSASLELCRCNITENSAGNGREGFRSGASDGCGGGIYNNRGNLNITECSIIKNNPGTGAIYPYAPGEAGGIANINGNMVLGNSLISNNSGGIYNRGKLTISNCEIHTNSIRFGGGIYNSGSSTITNSTIYKNGGTYGGGIYNKKGDLNVINSTINENLAAYGAGIYSIATLKLQNCTVSGNFADIRGAGAGICVNDSSLILNNCTVTHNRIDWSGIGGGGIAVDADYSFARSDVRVRNTIIANNQVMYGDNGHDCYGPIHSEGYNLIKNPEGCTIEGNETGNIYYQDPQLGPLTDNGGPTQTHDLMANSPAIDAGDPDHYEETDQRGVLRPRDGKNDGTFLPDIGAVELFSPQVNIIMPEAEAVVGGSVLIEAEANTRYVDFHIGSTRLFTADGDPHSYNWDTSLLANGSHQVKAIAYDVNGGISAHDQINVTIDNTVIQVEAARVHERAWIVRQLYGKVSFTIAHTGTVEPTHYVIERRDGDGVYNFLKEITASEVHGSTHTCIDPLPNGTITYTYRVTAVDGSGMVVGRSAEKTI